MIGHYAVAEKPNFVKRSKVQVFCNYPGDAVMPEMRLSVGSADRQKVDMIGPFVCEMLQVNPFPL